MRIVYIDDERHFINQLSELAEKYKQCRGVQLELQSYEKAELLLYDLAEEIFYDLYLLDINLGNGMSGLELAGQIREKDEKAQIVFLTFYSEFALEGYEYHPLHYILKSEIHKLEEILDQLIQKKKEDDVRFRLLRKQSGIEKIRYQTICYIYKRAKNCVYVCEDGRTYFERKSLAQLSEELCLPEMLPVGKSYIVNMNRIKKLDRQDIYFDCPIEPIHIPYQQVEFVKKSLFQFLKGEQS